MFMNYSSSSIILHMFKQYVCNSSSVCMERTYLRFTYGHLLQSITSIKRTDILVPFFLTNCTLLQSHGMRPARRRYAAQK